MVEDESAVVGVLTATRNAGRGKVVNGYKGNGGYDGVLRKGN